MERVTSVVEYKELIRWNKQRLEFIESNCFLMSSSMSKYIEEHRLYVQKYENGMIFFIDEGNYYNAYYFWQREQEFVNLHKDKPVLIEELNNKGSREVYLSGFEPILFRAGFQLFKNNVQVEINLKEYNELNGRLEECLEKLNAQGLQLVFCDREEQFLQAVSLWDFSLDVTDVPQDHKVFREEDTLACILTNGGQVVSTHWWRKTNKNSEGRHTVTHSDFYQKGLASTMLLAWCIEAKKEGIERCFTWINDQNIRSLALYQKIGFRANGRTSKQYILK